jgi:anti-sigma factor RsiW
MNPTIDDAELHAWVDGRLPAAAQARVAAALAEDPALAARAEHYRRQNEALSDLLADALDEPVPERLLRAARGMPAMHADDTAPTAEDTARARRPWATERHWLALAASFLIGIAGGWTLHATQTRAGPEASASAAKVRGLERAAAVAHAAYAPEVRHPVEVGASEQTHLVAWLSKRLGAPLKVPDLGAEGFRLIGGRLLPDDTGVAAQFMFETTGGQRLTLYVRRDAGGADTAFRFAEDGRLLTFYWLDRGFGYALSGELARDTMQAVATSVYRQLNP